MDISLLLSNWYRANKRTLPWRTSKNPYTIWVSEIILQQTRISQGLSYFINFTARFPTVQHLANAPIDEVLHAWQGLGYYSRARNMHQTAKIIVEKFHGVFPTSAKELQQLKGIGSYTAAAIASLCYNEKIPAIDGNVNRVISRLFDIETPIDKALGKKQIEAFANQLIENQNPGDFNQALMDFGSLICTPKQPVCNQCPVQQHCMAYIRQTQLNRPVKSVKTKISQRYFIYAFVTDGKQVFINKRTKNDIWKGLYELPLWEQTAQTTLEQWMETESFQKMISDTTLSVVHEYTAPVHKLSHQHLNARFVYIKCSKMPQSKHFVPINISDLMNYAFPRLLESYFLNQLPNYAPNFKFEVL